MKLEPHRYPKAETSDPEPVVLALETGRAHWSEGDPREAVRWLRRAAEHAEQSGDDVRALALARVAADLASAIPESVSVPVQTTPTTPTVTSDDFSDMTIVDAPEGAPRVMAALAAQMAAQSPSITAAKVVGPPTASPSTTVLSNPGALVVGPVAKAAAQGAAPTGPRATPSPPRLGSAQIFTGPTVADRPAPPARGNSTTVQSPILEREVRPRSAIRVAVTPAPGGGGGLNVRVLEDGTPVPQGAHEALLVAVEPDVDWLKLT